ncbi:hypothetical protein [Streptomyces sp. NPDC053431]|uniref:hypothetical protein n=1 Tax=Streptomyces sp. NPDC053431 TaxID=3365703 RepID=UPI0037D1B3EE
MVRMLDTMLAETGVRGPGAPRVPRVAGTEELLADSLDAVDDQIIALIARRNAFSSALRDVRQAARRPSADLTHENRVIRRYGTELGPQGGALGHLLVRMAGTRTA